MLSYWIITLLVVSFSVLQKSLALQYDIFLYAGTGSSGSTGSGGKATSATLNIPRSIWQDTLFSSYIAEASGLCIRKVSTSDIITTFAGVCGTSGSLGNGGPATSATFATPLSLFIDSSSKLYVADIGSYNVRQITTNSIISLFAGTGSTTDSGNGGPATSAGINQPHGIWASSNGDMYIVEYSGFAVRKVTSGTITGFAGTGSTGFSGDGGQATSAAITHAERMFGTTSGLLFLSDCGNNRVRAISASSIITTLIGTGTSTYNNDGLSATSTNINFPAGTYMHPRTGIFYVSEIFGNRIRSLSTSSIVSTFAGTGSASSTFTTPNGDGGDATSAQLCNPESLYVDSTGRFYVTGYIDFKVRVIYSVSPTSQPSSTPSSQPTRQPTQQPSSQPTSQPSTQPWSRPTQQPSSHPTCQPSVQPTIQPSSRPTRQPSCHPSEQPTAQPSTQPTCQPSSHPTSQPSSRPSTQPSTQPTRQPSSQPISWPSSQPTRLPTLQPTRQPTVQPSLQPTRQPSSLPSSQPSRQPSQQPTQQPTRQPSSAPSSQPSESPTYQPSTSPTRQPTEQPTSQPTTQPNNQPTTQPTNQPSAQPSAQPMKLPTVQPTRQPTDQPSSHPTRQPITKPTNQPSYQPTKQPTCQPSRQPLTLPTRQPSAFPSNQPTRTPSSQPSGQPTHQPLSRPTTQPSKQPIVNPSHQPTNQPTSQPTRQPSRQPTVQPSRQPTIQPSMQPSFQPTRQPSRQPSTQPSAHPTSQPFSQPSKQPSSRPSSQPTHLPINQPTKQPSSQPSYQPFAVPTVQPSMQPTNHPTVKPTLKPTVRPSNKPSRQPSSQPSVSPTRQPLTHPSSRPAAIPSNVPTGQPMVFPTQQPLPRPSSQPSHQPLNAPTSQPSRHPSAQPSKQPTSQPSSQPFWTPSSQPSKQPIAHPSSQPSRRPTQQPTAKPTAYHTHEPTSQSEQVRYYDLISVTDSTGRGVRWDKIRIELSFVLPSVLSVVDGYADVKLTGAVGGQSFVVYSDQVTSMNVTSHTPSTQGFLVSPSMGYDYSARSVSSLGDVNGDGFNDLIIGVPYASRCYVMFGNAEVGYVNMSLGFMVHGVSGIDLTGWSVSDAGDVNNDTFADILVGAPRASYGSVRSGAAYVLFGSDRVFRDVYLDDLSPEEGFVMHGESNEDCFGVSVAGAGDVNGDGVDDVLVGALKISSFYAGGAYIVFGGAARVQANALTGLSSVSVGNMSASDGVSLIGDAWSHSGCSVSGVGDINGDGFDDVLIGSAPLRRGSAVSSEVSYIVYGFDAVRLNVTSVKLSSESVPLVGGGVVVSGIADVNQDGMSDLLIVSNITMSAGVGYVMLYDLLRYAPSARPSVAPSTAPSTVSPTVKPFRSAVPSCGPVVSPSVVPTMSPTRPTAVPSVVPSGPSQCPTSRPSHFTEHPSSRPSMSPSSGPTHTSAPVSPTSSPTVYTEPPTTAVPSEMPSEIPSVSPSVCPSVLPSVSPTTVGPSVYPTLVPRVFAHPTLQPTFTVTHHMYSNVSVVLDGSSGGSVNRTEYALRGNYLWSAAVDVSLLGRGSVHGDVITVLPNVNCVLVVQHFNVSVDVIDLRAFPQYTSMKDLNITRGSVIITLPRSQIVRLLGIFPEDLRKQTFRFYAAKSSQPKQNASDRYLAVGCVVGFLLFLIVTAVYRYFVSAEKWLKQKRIADALIARQKPLIIHTHYFWRHSLIGKYHRNGSEDSLLDHASVHSGSVASWESSKDGDKGAAAKRFYAQLHASSDDEDENNEEEAYEGFDDEDNEIGSECDSIEDSEYSVPSNFTVDVDDMCDTV